MHMHLNFDQSKQNKQTGFLPLTEGYSSTVLVTSYAENSNTYPYLVNEFLNHFKGTLDEIQITTDL